MLKMLSFILPTNDVIGNIIILDFLHWEFIIGSLSWQLWKRFPRGDQTHSPLGTSRNRLRWHGLCHKGVAELEQQIFKIIHLAQLAHGPRVWHIDYNDSLFRCSATWTSKDKMSRITLTHTLHSHTPRWVRRPVQLVCWRPCPAPLLCRC